MNHHLVTHTIEPIYNSQSKILILGTMPSPKSREAGFYYYHPQNRFWKVLAAVLKEPFPATIPEKTELLNRRHIALWDVLASCEIAGAADGSIQNEIPNDFSQLLATAPIRAVFTTGTKATALYRKYCAEKTGITAQGLPSTSPANCRTSFDQLVEAYQIILPWLRENP